MKVCIVPLPFLEAWTVPLQYNYRIFHRISCSFYICVDLSVLRLVWFFFLFVMLFFFTDAPSTLE